MAIKLSTYLARLESLAVERPYFLTDASEKMAAETLSLIDEGFAQQRDPYGDAWKPTKQPNPILEETGAMRRGWSVLGISSSGFRVGNTTEYAAYHQGGTRYLPIRRMVPLASRGLGPIWGPRLKEIARASLVEALRGA